VVQIGEALPFEHASVCQMGQVRLTLGTALVVQPDANSARAVARLPV
jgi:hypothetical protein